MKGGVKMWYKKTAFILANIGALNWGFVGAFDWNFVNIIFGSIALLETIVYVIVGLCGIYALYEIFK